MNYYRVPTANANAVKLQAPDKSKLTNIGIYVSRAKITTYRTYEALPRQLPCSLWFCVSLQCGHAITYKN